MAKRKKYGECPVPRVLVKWYRGRVRRNMDELLDQGKSLRVFGFGVTEQQINSKFRLAKGFKRGEIMQRLSGCGFEFVDRNIPGEKTDAGLTIAIKPSSESKMARAGGA